MNKTKWEAKSEYVDGTGDLYYQCQCPQMREGSSSWLDRLYGLCYFPTENKLWFWDECNPDGETIRMNCTSWEQAEATKQMLTKGKSHWMEPA